MFLFTEMHRIRGEVSRRSGISESKGRDTSDEKAHNGPYFPIRLSLGDNCLDPVCPLV